MKAKRKELQQQIEQIDRDIENLKKTIQETMFDINDKKREKQQIIRELIKTNKLKITKH